MAKYYSGIDTSVGVGAETLNGMLANGSDFGVLPSKDIDCANINASGIHTVGGFFYPNGGIKDSSNSTGASGKVLSSTGSGLAWIDPSEGSTANAVNVGTNLNSTDADQFVAFMGASSGNNPVRVDNALRYNPTGSQGLLKVDGDILVESDIDGANHRRTQIAPGAIDLARDNPSIDFKTGVSENFDCRIVQNSNGLDFLTGGDSSTSTVLSLTSNKEVQLPDLGKLQLGDNQELSIFHKPDTNDVRVEVESNTNYILLTKTFDLKNAGGSKAAITATNPGGVPEVLLYHDGNERLKTTSNGVTITGTVSATAFSGDGSALTGISDTNTQLSTEQVQDIVGGMVSGNTESGITVSYDDAGTGTGKLNFSVINAFPSGGIIIWSGAASAIPTGWVLCDGNNSTPDLRDRFVVGASDSTGDSTYPGLSPNCTPGGAATDTVNISDSASVVFGANGTGTASKAGSSSATVSISDSDTVNTLPPYYALCYIMKT